MAFPLLVRRAFIRASVAWRSGLVMPSSVVTRSRVLASTPVVAWSGVFGTVIAGARSFVATSIVFGLRAAAAAYLLARHRTIVASIAFRTGHGTTFCTAVTTFVCSGRDNSGTVEFSGTRRRGDCRSAVI